LRININGLDVACICGNHIFFSHKISLNGQNCIILA
jgi:hypothetical protein